MRQGVTPKYFMCDSVQMRFTVSALLSECYYLNLNVYWNLQVGNKMSLKKENVFNYALEMVEKSTK